MPPMATRADRGEQEIPLEAFDGSLTPGEQRSDRGEQQEQQGNRDSDAIEKRRPDRDFVSLNKFRQDREKRAPQYGEADHEQEEIVEQETGFARHQRFQFVLALEVRPVRYKEKGADRQGQHDEDQEPGADRGLRKGVHRTDHTRTREERPEHGEQEGREDERHVPDFQHAAFFLHHDGMQKRRAGEPGHERGILHRVPSPVAAPSEDSVSPVRAEENADGEEAPGHHGPAARNLNPFLAGVLHDERAQCEGEGNGEADVSQVEHGRMDDHLGILQKRIQPGAIRGERALHDGEWVRREIQNQQEENLHRGDDHRSVGEQPLIGFVAQAENEPVPGQQQRPEQQRAFLTGPQHGELIGGRQVAVAVMEDIGDGEIVVERGQLRERCLPAAPRRTWRFRRGGRSHRDEPTRHPGGTTPRSLPGNNTHSGRAPAAAQSFRFETLQKTPQYLFSYFFREAGGMQTAGRSEIQFFQEVAGARASCHPRLIDRNLKRMVLVRLIRWKVHISKYGVVAGVVPNDFVFKAGQYIDLNLSGFQPGASSGLTHTFSIASSPFDEELVVTQPACASIARSAKDTAGISAFPSPADTCKNDRLGPWLGSFRFRRFGCWSNTRRGVLP